jgi:hypothetical protein
MPSFDMNFIKAQAAQLRSADKPPATRPFPEKTCPLQPKVLGALQRDGYCVEYHQSIALSCHLPISLAFSTYAGFRKHQRVAPVGAAARITLLDRSAA